jgi:hypothetical protein
MFAAFELLVAVTACSRGADGAAASGTSASGAGAGVAGWCVEYDDTELRTRSIIAATELPMPPEMKVTAITLDCPAPRALAAFYQQVTGLELVPESDDDFAGLSGGDGRPIGKTVAVGNGYISI